MSAIVDLAERIPEALLLNFTSEKYRDFLWAVSSLRHLAMMCETGQSSAAGGLLWPSVGPGNALTRLWLLLRECPDEAIAESTPTLAFLKDELLQTSIQRDISSAESDLNNGVWKSATVMAGAALEALLLWAVQQSSEDASTAYRTLGLKKHDAKHPDIWDLFEYIDVTHKLKAISDETQKQAHLAQDFRNLIHPGREMRKQMKCDRGTARSALAAVDHVVRDLESRFR